MKIIKICERCNSTFESKKEDLRRFCSLLCSNKSRGKTPKQSLDMSTTRNTNGCLDFTGALKSGGYGRVHIGEGKYRPAHRVAWELHHGDIPEGMCVLHKCDRPVCCEVSHLFLGTQADNVSDMMLKGRNKQIYGEDVHLAKLNEHQVLQIKARIEDKAKPKDIAKEFNISISTIRDINKRRSWRHIK